MSFRLLVLGGLSLEADDRPISGRNTQRRRLALLALLGTAGERGVRRDRVLALLWPESDEEHARHALSQSLYAIRQQLGPNAVLSGVDELRLNPALVACDVVEFERAISAGDANAAAGFYRGAFLDGFSLPDNSEFEDWSSQKRTELQHLFAAVLDRLAADASARGDPAAAVEWLRKRAALEPLNSEVALRLMRAHADTGDRAAALRVFRTNTALLQSELGLGPDANLSAFALALSTQPPEVPKPEPARVAASPTIPASAPARRRVRRLALGAFAGVVVAAGALGALALRAPTPDESVHPVVLGSVIGPDSGLALAVREALRAELEQGKAVQPLPDGAIQRTLSLMLRPPNTVLDAEVAAEVAQRRGVTLVITGSLQPVGTGAHIVARLLDAQSEQILWTVTERPNSESEILPAIARMAAAMRQHVAGRRPQRLNALPAVSTNSLPALRSFALARQALLRADRQRALELTEAALVHDSTFALAHYLAGDLLWFIDQQRHSNEHLRKANELAARLSPRERLIVSARYQQLIEDQPDSALVFWKLLADSYPDEALAYEGMRWAYRALGQTKPMAEASALAFQRDSTFEWMYLLDRVDERIEANDTAAAFKAADALVKAYPSAPDQARFHWALHNGRPDAMRDLRNTHYEMHLALVIRGELSEARPMLESHRRAGTQSYPRMLLAQARMELELINNAAAARADLRDFIQWLEQADVSPPAYARLAERGCELGARVGDDTAVQRLRVLIDRLDDGRQLRSYTMARVTLDACTALARGDPRSAARLAELAARSGMFYGRSLATIKLLEADARARAGDSAGARAIHEQLAAPSGIPDGDLETRGLIRVIAQRRLSR